jgi:hypothetical protein
VKAGSKKAAKYSFANLEAQVASTGGEKLELLRERNHYRPQRIKYYCKASSLLYFVLWMKDEEVNVEVEILRPTFRFRANH